MLQNLQLMMLQIKTTGRLVAVAYGRGSYNSGTYSGAGISGTSSSATSPNHWWIWLIVSGVMLITATGLMVWARRRKNKVYTPPYNNSNPQSPQEPTAQN